MEEPAKIRKLDEIVVNRIAAGEIIQRPANALKELIENSLDAKSTNIQITAKEGGLKLLQIQDNGTGIRKEDMEIVCERFTTSKLQQFDDLKSISTFGFRGEALASISHVALLTITTKTAAEKCGYKASYTDSKLRAPPKPCASNQGTTILIENLFYNVATRRKALGSAAEEFAKIADVVTRYAVHNPTVGFTLKKHGEVVPQVRTPHNSTKLNNIKILYGNTIARELIEIENTDETYKFKTHALVTNPNHTSKRMTFLLFINHRLVDSTPIRKMLEELYSFYLPKKAHPWCYISLEINPSSVDVNVHPTKHEVRFLHEDAIVERIKTLLDEKLASNNASRTFHLKARVPQVDISRDALREVLPEYDKDNGDKTKKIYPHEMVRASSSDQKLDKFNFTVQSPKDSSIRSSNTFENELNDLIIDPLDFNKEFQIENTESTKVCTLRNSLSKEKIVESEDPAKDRNLEKKTDELSKNLKRNLEVSTDNSDLGTNAKRNITEPSNEDKNSKENDYGKVRVSDILLPNEIDNNEKSSRIEKKVESGQILHALPSFETLFQTKKLNDSPSDCPDSRVSEILLPIETPPHEKSSNDVDKSRWSDMVNESSSGQSNEIEFSVNSMQVDEPQKNVTPDKTVDPPSTEDESSSDMPVDTVPRSKPAEEALKIVYKYYGSEENIEPKKKKSTENIGSKTMDKEAVEDKKETASSRDDSVASNEEDESSSKFKCYSINPFRVQVKLHSILSLRKEIEDNYHEGLREILSKMIFVGCVDEKSALVQSGLNLYICNTQKLVEELFYEIMLYDFENFGLFKFSEPLPLEDLALLGLEDDRAGWSEEDGAKDEIASQVRELLLEKADLLNEYFSIRIDKKGNLKSLPVVLDKYVPYEAELPLYVLRLATEVDWTYEKECLAGICRETAKFYSYMNTSDEAQNWKHVVEHVLYPAMKESLLPPKYFSHDSTILQVASLPDLYKVFERC